MGARSTLLQVKPTGTTHVLAGWSTVHAVLNSRMLSRALFSHKMNPKALFASKAMQNCFTKQPDVRTMGEIFVACGRRADWICLENRLWRTTKRRMILWKRKTVLL
jgi:hypothetical protein